MPENTDAFSLSRARASAEDAKVKSDQPELIDSELTNSMSAAKVGMSILGIAIGAFLLWAIFVPLDEGVPTQGMVTIETKRRVVQHLRGGIIQEVNVREGQTVKEGDLLFRLDREASKAASLAADQEIQSLKENLVSQQAILEGLATAEKQRRDQLALIEKELSGIRELVQEGYAPMTQQWQLERARAETQTTISDLQTNTRRTQQTVLDLKHQLRAAEQRARAAKDDLERTEIRAPASGQVVGLAIQSVGAVIQPAERLLDIVPKGETLVLDARIPPISIDRIKEGDIVDIRFSSFARSPQLVVEGKLFSLSQDVLTDPATGESYYLARVLVTEDGMKKLEGRNMQAGMPAEVVIKTGERTVLQYLLYPLTRRIAGSMKEE